VVSVTAESDGMLGAVESGGKFPPIRCGTGGGGTGAGSGGTYSPLIISVLISFLITGAGLGGGSGGLGFHVSSDLTVVPPMSDHSFFGILILVSSP